MQTLPLPREGRVPHRKQQLPHSPPALPPSRHWDDGSYPLDPGGHWFQRTRACSPLASDPGRRPSRSCPPPPPAPPLRFLGGRCRAHFPVGAAAPSL
eukprot:scaffold101796_cov28-Tisochrysis_lutea.AAC.5